MSCAMKTLWLIHCFLFPWAQIEWHLMSFSTVLLPLQEWSIWLIGKLFCRYKERSYKLQAAFLTAGWLTANIKLIYLLYVFLLYKETNQNIFNMLYNIGRLMYLPASISHYMFLDGVGNVSLYKKYFNIVFFFSPSFWRNKHTSPRETLKVTFLWLWITASPYAVRERSWLGPSYKDHWPLTIQWKSPC